MYLLIMWQLYLLNDLFLPEEFSLADGRRLTRRSTQSFFNQRLFIQTK